MNTGQAIADESQCPWLFFIGPPGTLQYASSIREWFITEFGGNWSLVNDDGWWSVEEAET